MNSEYQTPPPPIQTLLYGILFILRIGRGWGSYPLFKINAHFLRIYNFIFTKLSKDIVWKQIE